jgi:hypothetical protein
MVTTKGTQIITIKNGAMRAEYGLRVYKLNSEVEKKINF